jgi:hypothetical protein
MSKRRAGIAHRKSGCFSAVRDVEALRIQLIENGRFGILVLRVAI